MIGQAGMLRMIVDDAREVILATYASPCTALLFEVVPLADRLLPAANEPMFRGNVPHG